MFVALRQRAGAVVLALFLLRIVVPEMGHECASTADAVAAVATADVAPEQAQAHAHVHAAANEQTHEQTHEQTQHGTAHGEHVHGNSGVDATSDPSGVPMEHCDCAALCCCLPNVVQPGVLTPTLLSVEVRIDSRLVATSHDAPLVRHDWSLPFATAPPRG